MRKHHFWNKTRNMCKNMCKKGTAAFLVMTVFATSLCVEPIRDYGKSYVVSYASEASAKRTMEIAKQEWETAKSEAEAAKKNAQNARTLKAQGSYGYFKKNGYSDAMKVLESKEEWVTKYTTIGGEKDATGYDNFKDSIDFLKETNEYRLKEGVDPTSKKPLGELTVSMQLMAISEVHSNWSAVNMRHSQKYRVSENLAWGYDDPFIGWFDKEKKIWLAALDNKTDYPDLDTYESAYDISVAYPAFYQSVGHYLNICNASSKYMGFSINNYGSFDITHGQTFKGSGYKDVMSVSEFEKSVSDYCADIDAKISAEATASAKEAQAKSAYESSVSAYNTELAKNGSAIVGEHTTVNSKADLKKIVISDTVTTMKNNFFVGCKKLKTIEIGKNVKKIPKKAFAGCKSVKTVIIKTKKLTNKNVGKNAFKVFSKKTVIKVPKSKYKAYKKLLKKKVLKEK